jgi:acetamidase/formamidase
MKSGTVLAVKPSHEEFAWTFGGAAPLRCAESGTILEVFTEDCYAGRVRSSDDLPSAVCPAPYRNPQTGPFFVEGAEPGDTIALHFVAIDPARDWAVSSVVPYFGALTSTFTTASLQPPLPETVWIWDVDRLDGTCTFHARDSDVVVRLPLDPMHGTVGVAPAGLEVRSALAPGPHGGNLDTPEMRAGTTCYLGVNVPGALFSLGDGHARQGEGETCGVAVECAMNTVVQVELIKDRRTPWPRLETDTHIMSAGSARPLEDAFRIAQLDLVTWVAERCSLSRMDAYQLVSQTVESPLANVCGASYTAIAKVRKAWLPSTSPVDDVHRQLRSAASSYLRATDEDNA